MMIKVNLIRNKLSKKIFLLVLFLLIFLPNFSIAITCSEAGGSCETTCPGDTLPGTYDPCPSGKVCCNPEDPTLEEDNYSEGSPGFMFLTGHIVPCGRNTNDPGTDENETAECTLCHLFLMLKRVFDLVLSLLIIVAILFITIGGVIYIVSTGNSNLTGIAKNIIKKTLIGFALMMAGWLMVYTLLVFLSAGDFGMVGEGGSWYEFTCHEVNNFD